MNNKRRPVVVLPEPILRLLRELDRAGWMAARIDGPCWKYTVRFEQPFDEDRLRVVMYRADWRQQGAVSGPDLWGTRELSEAGRVEYYLESMLGPRRGPAEPEQCVLDPEAGTLEFKC